MNNKKNNIPKYKNVNMVSQKTNPNFKSLIPINTNTKNSSSQKSRDNLIAKKKNKIRPPLPSDYNSFIKQQSKSAIPLQNFKQVENSCIPVQLETKKTNIANYDRPYASKNTIKNKVTIIIPTLQVVFKDITLKMVEQICLKTKFVYEVIIINNANSDMMTESFKQYPMVSVVNDLPNLYVNSAWNYGLSRCNTEYYCLLNDDVVFFPELLDSLVKFLTLSPHLNVTTVSTHVFGHREKAFYRLEHMTNFNPNLTHEIRQYPTNIKQGWFLFGRTSSWVPIEIAYTGEIMNGDDWILQRNMEQYGSVVLIKNNLLIHAESSTVLTVQDNIQYIKSISKP